MEIFTFDKSLQERLVDFSEILSNREDIVPASQIRSEWAYHIELVIEPVGWRALWKIPKFTCQDFEIHYPTIVVVEVQHVNFAELTSLVKIVAVQDDIHLPEEYDVPLIELYATQVQENDALDMVGTANCIDELRFFYNYLWMPWDADDDDNADWVATHLEARLRLFFDMKRGSVCKKTCDVIRSLMREGREIQAKISRLETDMSDDEDEQEGSLDEGKACQLLKLHFRLQQIKTEMEVMENPAMRNMLIRHQGTSAMEVETKRRESGIRRLEGYFVWLGGSLEDTISSLSQAKGFLPPDTLVKTSSCLKEALDSCDAGDIVILGKGNHPIRGSGNLEDGGMIKGINSRETTVLCPKETESGPSLLDFSGGEVVLENLTVDLGDLQAGILVRKGTVKLDGCKIHATNKSVIKIGIVVLPGAKLISQNTTFVGLGTAVMVHSSGDAILSECSFEECIEGIQLQDNARLTMTNSSLTNFKEYGIRLELEKNSSDTESKTGGTELLENISDISLEGCKFGNNGKGDVLLKSQTGVSLLTKSEAMIS
ncbi:protein nessun dorma [Belonocnema kinseyi]|uniref:protein nessun dorma n=1 Tax=Belonocnema kinseyi TaxID=2817044 RepID=UPI00143D314C|nr:protein nessun dorma [Belonocnema kinseyi]XP_033209283.1 protein nessun dorma [Belonocnema kinseyi]